MKKNELRRDPVTGIWAIIIKEQGIIEEKLQLLNEPSERKKDTKCIYCEGHESETEPELFCIASSERVANEKGWRVRVIPDKFPVLQIHGSLNNRGLGIYDILDGIGAHEIVVEVPKHNCTFDEFEESQVAEAFEAYQERLLDLKKDSRFRYVLLHKFQESFEDNPSQHSTSHIIATPITPLLVKLELTKCMDHFQIKERCLLCDIIHQEQMDGSRVLIENEHCIAIAPFASRIPFQIMILPKRHETFFEKSGQLNSIASITKSVIGRLKNKVGIDSYVMEIHSGPNKLSGELRGYWKTLDKDFHWHIEVLPKTKLLGTFDEGSGFNVNSVPPERAVELLR